MTMKHAQLVLMYLGLWVAIITGLATVVLAVVATLGVSAWRRQMRSDVQLRAAIAIRRGVLRFRDSIRRFRNPYNPPEELQVIFSRIKDGEIGSFHREVFRIRWPQVVTALHELETAELEGEILWGEAFSTRMRKLYGIYSELEFSVYQYLNVLANEDLDPEKKKNQLRRWAKVTGGKFPGEPPDEFENKLLSAIDDLDRFLRPRIQLRR